MRHNVIPCCFFPTTTVFVDDNPTFLEHLSLVLNLNQSKLSKYFNTPTDALTFINQKPDLASLFRENFYPNKNDSVDPLDRLVEQIHHIIFWAQRFEYVSVVAVDQVMPQMNGLDLCVLIRNPSVRKIILTGEADEKFAIQAFNEGLINYFIRKDRDDFGKDLNIALANLQQGLFEEASQSLINSLVASNHPCPLNDPVFVKFFQHLCETESIEEYYLLDVSGSFLLVDSSQKLKWLIVKTDEELDHFAEFIEDENAPNSLSDPLRTRKDLIYFYSTQDSLKTPHDWKQFMYPIQGRLAGRLNYYYAIVDNIVASGFDKAKVVPL